MKTSTTRLTAEQRKSIQAERDIKFYDRQQKMLARADARIEKEIIKLEKQRNAIFDLDRKIEKIILGLELEIL